MIRHRLLVLSIVATGLVACNVREESENDRSGNAVAAEEASGDYRAGQRPITNESFANAVRSGRLETGVPDGWTQTSDTDGQFTHRFVAGPGEGQPTLALSPEFGNFSTARVGMTALIGDIQIGTPGFRVLRTTDIDVPGATSAVRLDFSYGTEETRGVFGGTWIVAADERTNDAVAVALSAPAPLDRALADRIQASLVMHPRE